MTVLLRDQIESFRYANHLWPILMLRLYVGYFFFSSSLLKVSKGFLDQPRLSASIDEFLFSGAQVPGWISAFYLNFVQADWFFWSKLIVNLEWFMGLLFFLGFLTRPTAIFAMMYLYLFSYIAPSTAWPSSLQLIVMLLVIVFFGAGRVGGVDYFFYKRQRGLIW